MLLSPFPKAQPLAPQVFDPNFCLIFITAKMVAFLISRTLTAFCNKIVAGHCPKELVPYFAGARLIARSKKQGGVRPIAVGEVLRRLIAKCALASVSGPITQALKPLQLGVGVPLGTETIIHAVNTILENHCDCPESDASDKGTDKVILQVDFTNAFNLVDRTTFLNAVREVCPSLAPFAELIYTSKLKLFLSNGEIILSTGGVQQGDPLGPALFALALNVIVKKIAAEPGCKDLLLNVWFLDDGTLCGPIDAVKKAFEVIISEAPSIGLELNRSKCCVFWPNADCNILSSQFPGVSVRSDGIIVLGSPVGDPQFCQDDLINKMESLFELVEASTELDDPQLQLILLRACLGLPKVVYHLRTTPPNIMSSIASTFDKRMSPYITQIVGCELSPAARFMWGLPFSAGGFGLPEASSIYRAAFYASCVNCYPLLQSLDINNLDRVDFNLNSTALRSMLPPSLAPSIIVVSALSNVPSGTQVQQRTVMKHIMSHALSVKISNGHISQREQILIKAHSTKFSHQWVSALPNPARGRSLEKPMFQVLLQYHTGIPIVFHTTRCQCGTPIDTFGDHFLSCRYSGLIARHDALVMCVARICSEVHLPFKTESVPLNADIFDPDSRKRPGDIVIFNADESGRHICADLSVVSTMAASYSSAALKKPLGAAELRAKAKLNKYREVDNFIPLVVETLCICHPFL
jgi:hypothetical protein